MTHFNLALRMDWFTQYIYVWHCHCWITKHFYRRKLRSFFPCACLPGKIHLEAQAIEFFSMKLFLSWASSPHFTPIIFVLFYGIFQCCGTTIGLNALFSKINSTLRSRCAACFATTIIIYCSGVDNNLAEMCTHSNNGTGYRCRHIYYLLLMLNSIAIYFACVLNFTACQPLQILQAYSL